MREINENLKNKLYEKLNEINDLEIRNFVKEVLDNAPVCFWVRESSSTGKYHPLENQGNGGIIRHVLKCFSLAKDFCFLLELNKNNRDVVLASIILHDIRKYENEFDEYTTNEHGKLGFDFLERFDLREPEKTKIRNCVRYHLGPFTKTPGDIERGRNLSQNELIVYLVDIACSRKYASWLPGVEVSLESIKKFSGEEDGN